MLVVKLESNCINVSLHIISLLDYMYSFRATDEHKQVATHECENVSQMLFVVACFCPLPYFPDFLGTLMYCPGIFH